MRVYAQSYCRGGGLFAVDALISSLSDFTVHLWSDLLPVSHESDRIYVQKQAVGAALPLTCEDVHFPHPHQANPGLLGEGPGVPFRPLSHKIPFCAVRGRGSGRGSASVAQPHQGHTNITSVQLLSSHRCISFVMKRCAESTGQHAVLNPGRTAYLAGSEKLNFGLSSLRNWNYSELFMGRGCLKSYFWKSVHPETVAVALQVIAVASCDSSLYQPSHVISLNRCG